MSFKSGDLVEVVKVPNASYPTDALPGTRATIVQACPMACACAFFFQHQMWVINNGARNLCASEPTLRKIDDDDGKQPSTWDECVWKPPAKVT